LTAIAPVVWGTTYVVTTQFLPGGHSLFAALMRSLPAGIIALILSGSLPRGSWWWKALVLGTLNIGAFFPLLFLTAQRLPGGVAATLGATQPIIVAGLAVPVLRERPDARTPGGWDGVSSVWSGSGWPSSAPPPGSSRSASSPESAGLCRWRSGSC
jgi:probable blue pigment (indigoidine) exporter